MWLVNITLDFLDFLWISFLLLAPMLMLGLFLCGLIHVFISRRSILRWFQHDSLKSVSMSAALGVPIPLCSCSVVPVVTEMHRKGASRSACMSFLITAPETGADSILVTNAFFGPIAAIVRPVVSFFTAVFCGIFCIGMIRDSDSDRSSLASESHLSHDHDHDHDHDHGDDCGHDHSHETLFREQDDCYVSMSQLRALVKDYCRRCFNWFNSVRYVSWLKPDFYQQQDQLDRAETDTHVEETDENPPVHLGTLVKHIFRYGFVEVADDILFALIVGILLGGILYLAIPSDLMANEYARWLAYPVVVLVGIPLYICASASTPIAAAMVAKGVSPGAALVFLMTGPATNTGTIAIVARQFGMKFASLYVMGVIVATVFFGVMLDLFMIAVGWQISVNLSASEAPAILILQWGGVIGLVALMIWRFRAGAFKSGWDDLWINVKPLWTRFLNFWHKLTRGRKFLEILIPNNPVGLATWLITATILFTSGFTIIPPGHVGYGIAFGKARWQNLEPGLHYLAPAPFVRVDKWPVQQIVSLNTDANHEYVSGDVNLLQTIMAVQYRIQDPYTYYYKSLDPQNAIRAYVESHIRTYISARPLEPLLNRERDGLEEYINSMLTESLHTPDNEVIQSIEFVKANLMVIKPASEAIEAFRRVSSAQEDKERVIVNAQRFMVALTPQAYGNAEYEIKQAEGLAFRRTTVASAEADAISQISQAAQTAPEVLHNMLWREKLESALSGNPKVIVPNQDSLDRVSLWRRHSQSTGPAASEKKQ